MGWSREKWLQYQIIVNTYACLACRMEKLAAADFVAARLEPYKHVHTCKDGGAPDKEKKDEQTKLNF